MAMTFCVISILEFTTFSFESNQICKDKLSILEYLQCGGEKWWMVFLHRYTAAQYA